jgi:hypothetical protein
MARSSQFQRKPWPLEIYQPYIAEARHFKGQSHEYPEPVWERLVKEDLSTMLKELAILIYVNLITELLAPQFQGLWEHFGFGGPAIIPWDA